MSRPWRFGACRRLGAAIVTVLLLGSGCTGGADRRRPDEAVRPQWHEINLPQPPGGPGRLMVRDVAACDGRWYVVGAIGGSGEATRPAAWTSADARTWTSLILHPKSYWGPQHVFYSAACRGGRLVVLGAKRGGAHANPRTSTWYRRPDGSLVEVVVPYTVYGGPQAINVARVVAGPLGWLITGNRMSGAAVWVSPDGVTFAIVEAAPELASDGRGESWAFDAVATSGGWLLVGGFQRPGRIDRDPLAWSSSDGRTWRRAAVPGTDRYDELQRVVLADGVPVAVGLRDRGFGSWRRGPAGWEQVGGFGGVVADGPPVVRALTTAGGQLLAVVSDGVAHALWTSPDEGRSWRPVAAPAALPSGGSLRSAAAFGDGDRLLLVADDGRAGRLWWTGSLASR